MKYGSFALCLIGFRVLPLKAPTPDDGLGPRERVLFVTELAARCFAIKLPRDLDLSQSVAWQVKTE
jgi:hypothetical protein